MKYLEDRKDLEIETRLSRLGRAPAEHSGMVNMPVCRGSTIVSEEEYESAKAERSDGQLRPLWLASVPRTRACHLRTGGRLSLAPVSVGALCLHAFASRRSERRRPRPDQRRGLYTRQDIRGRGTLKTSGHRAILLSNAAFRAFSENHPEYPGHLSGITFVPHV